MIKKIKLFGIFIFISINLFAKTNVILLGTGTPIPDSKRAGAGTAVVYNGKAYLFDMGRGVVQNIIKASQELKIDALKMWKAPKINHLFITHLHSDHISDFPTFASTVWWRRTEQLNLYGPTGIKDMYKGYEKFLATDVKLRVDGIQPVKNPKLYQSLIHEYDDGWTFKDGDVLIEAFKVPHGEIKTSFGYKITTPDKTIVISGDTSYSEKIIEMSKGVDILIHEVISDEGLSKLPEFWQKYHKSYHTTASDLAKVANQAKPKLLVLTHILSYSSTKQKTFEEVKNKYKGKVILGNDLDIL